LVGDEIVEAGLLWVLVDNLRVRQVVVGLGSEVLDLLALILVQGFVGGGALPLQFSRARPHGVIGRNRGVGLGFLYFELRSTHHLLLSGYTLARRLFDGGFASVVRAGDHCTRISVLAEEALVVPILDSLPLHDATWFHLLDLLSKVD